MPQTTPVLAALAVTLASLSGCVQTAPVLAQRSAAPTPAAATPEAVAPPAAAASAAPASAPPATTAAQPPRPSALTAPLMYEILVGEISFDLGDPQQGAAYLLDAARHASDEALYKRATEMAIQSRAGPVALEAVRAWRRAYPDSLEASRYELQVLLALGRVADTAPALQGLLAALPADEKISFITALPALYQRVADKAVAQHAIEQALSEAREDPALAPAAWTSIGRMRLAAGDTAGALSAATLGMSADPHSEWPVLLALQLFGGASEDRAEPLIRRYLVAPDAKPEIQIAYARALAERGRGADAQAQLTDLIMRQPEYADAWLMQGLLDADEREDTKARAALERYLDLIGRQGDQPGIDRSVGRNQAYLTLARIAARQGDDGAAEQWLARVDSPEQALAAQVQRANILARQGHMAEALEAIEAVPEHDADDARLKLLAKAQLLRDNGQAERAYQLLSDALKQSPDDDGLLYDTAMAAERANRMDDMERLLRRVIELKPKSAQAYNALGYSLADHNQRLPEARQLIEKAVTLAPDDAYIQDSLGWVEFRLGHLKEARRILEAAFTKRPDAEIAAHLGEVLWTLGERDAARAMWRNGLRLDARNETLTRTLERLQVKP